MQHRGRPAELARAHPAVDHHQRRLERRPRPGSGDPGGLASSSRRCARSACSSSTPTTRPADRMKLALQAQRAAGLAGVRRVAGRRAHRHRVDAAHRRRPAPVRRRLHRAPGRRAAPVGRRRDAGQAHLLDAPAERHLRPARPALHGRGGRLPPAQSATRPTKPPIMLLLKQARAFGVGVVLSTQNPVDVDYKALSNAGTWMIGRLQTEQDKARLLDGLTSAAGTIDPRAVGDTISALGKREFVLKRASKDAVSVFTTRWAMSYLRGPLTREQVRVAARHAGAVRHLPASAAARPAPIRPATSTAPGGRARSEPAAAGTAPAAPLPAGDARWQPTRRRCRPRSPPASPCTTWTRPPRGRRSVGAVPGNRLDARGHRARAAAASTTPRPGSCIDQEHEAVLSAADRRSRLPEAFRAVDYDDRDLLPAPPPGAIYRLPPTEVSAKTWWTAAAARPRRAPAGSRCRSRSPPTRSSSCSAGSASRRSSSPRAARRRPRRRGQGGSLRCSRKYATKITSAHPARRRQGALDRAQAAARTTHRDSDTMGACSAASSAGAEDVGVHGRPARDRPPRAACPPRRTGPRSLERGLVDLQAELDAEMDRHPRRVAGQGGRRSSRWRSPWPSPTCPCATIGLVWIPTGT